MGVVIFGEYFDIKEGDEVRRTGELLSVPCGEQLIGRVVDPLGRPLDGKGDIDTSHRRPLEYKAPGIAARQPVNEPLQTGLSAIDSMIPIGRGQRELIIGDRRTGKTAIALDTIINQKGEDVICVYVAVGQKESTVVGVVEKLARRRGHGLHHRGLGLGRGSGPAAVHRALRRRRHGRVLHVQGGAPTLVVYDDLTRQAHAYRQLSLLLRRPPGREAYPGDVFYLHSRLLERAVKLRDEYAIVPKDTPEDSIDRSVAIKPPAGQRPIASIKPDDPAGIFHRPEGFEKAASLARVHGRTRTSTGPQISRQRWLDDGAADHRDPGR